MFFRAAGGKAWAFTPRKPAGRWAGARLSAAASRAASDLVQRSHQPRHGSASFWWVSCGRACCLLGASDLVGALVQRVQAGEDHMGGQVGGGLAAEGARGTGKHAYRAAVSASVPIASSALTSRRTARSPAARSRAGSWCAGSHATASSLTARLSRSGSPPVLEPAPGLRQGLPAGGS